MWRIDVYKTVKKTVKNGKPEYEKKKVSSHWYSTEHQAKKVSDLLYRMPFGVRVFTPREGKSPIAVEMGGYTTSKPVFDNTFK